MAGASFLLSPRSLKLCNIDESIQEHRSPQRNVRVFKAHFGKHPLHLSRVWRDLQIHGLMTREEAKMRESFVGFLVAKNFLRCYEVDDVRGARFDIGLDSLEETTWAFIDRIVGLKQHKVKCPNQWPVNLYASCDGTHMPTQEPRYNDL